MDELIPDDKLASMGREQHHPLGARAMSSRRRVTAKRSRAPRTPPAEHQGELTPRELALLGREAPEVFHELMSNQPNWRRLAWAEPVIQVLRQLFGLASLFVLALVAWHAIDAGDATQGASIICTGAVSIVTVFVTGRLVTKKNSRS
jgi:hypothetical protein